MVRSLEILKRCLRYGHHEVLLTTADSLGNANTAPMGVELVIDGGHYVVVRPYTNTTTYRNLLDIGEAVVNITNDALLYYYSLLKPERLNYVRSRRVRPPRLSGGVDLYVECVVSELVSDGPEVAVFKLKPVYVARGLGSNLAFSRANALVIEALVHYTKLAPLTSLGYLDEVRRRFEIVSYVREVVRRVGSVELIEAIEDIYSRCLNLVEDLKKH